MTGVVESVLGVVAIKACVAVPLAVAAVLAGRWVRRPALAHGLWVFFLLELLVPPVLEVGVLPRTGLAVELPVAAGLESTEILAVGPLSASDAVIAETAVSDFPWPVALAATWTAGVIGLLLLTAIRVRRFGRLLSNTTDPPAGMTTAGARLAARLGLARCPRIRVVPAVISPMLRPTLGSLEVLFPAALIPLLADRERDALLAHELAHVRRRDHLVRFLELVAATAFWWHPGVWFARRKLRRVEELCCDELVLATLPGHARAYATGLVKTVEFLAGSRAALPALASGVGKAKILEERLIMIMKRRPKHLSRPLRLVLAFVAAALLLVFPTWADRATDDGADLREREKRLEQNAAAVRESVLALEAQARELERDLRDIRARQRDLELDLERQLEELEIRHLEARGATGAEAAEQIRNREQWLLERAELEAEHDRLEAQRMQELSELEAEGARDAAEARALELDAMQRAVDAATRRQLDEERLTALQEELEALVLRADELDSAGLHEAAQELDRQIEQLDRLIEDLESTPD